MLSVPRPTPGPAKRVPRTTVAPHMMRGLPVSSRRNVEVDVDGSAQYASAGPKGADPEGHEDRCIGERRREKAEPPARRQTHHKSLPFETWVGESDRNVRARATGA